MHSGEEQRERTLRDYEQRIGRVLVRISEELESELTPTSLARTAAFSSHHFQRIFHAVTGRTLGEYIRGQRLNRAAKELRETKTPIMHIAGSAGYETQESFTRAFARRFGTSPAAFRRSGGAPGWRDDPTVIQFRRGNMGTQRDAHSKEADAMMEVNIQEVPKQRLAFIAPKDSSAEQVGLAAGTLMAHLAELGLSRFDVIHVLGEAPASGDMEERYDMGIAIGADVHIDDPSIRLGEIGSGEHAVAHYNGDFGSKRDAYDFLYGQGLPSRGLEPRDHFAFEQTLGLHFADVDLDGLDAVEAEMRLEAHERELGDIAVPDGEACRICIPIQPAGER